MFLDSPPLWLQVPLPWSLLTSWPPPRPPAPPRRPPPSCPSSPRRPPPRRPPGRCCPASSCVRTATAWVAAAGPCPAPATSWEAESRQHENVSKEQEVKEDSQSQEEHVELVSPASPCGPAWRRWAWGRAGRCWWRPPSAGCWAAGPRPSAPSRRGPGSRGCQAAVCRRPAPRTLAWRRASGTASTRRGIMKLDRLAPLETDSPGVDSTPSANLSKFQFHS